MKRHITVLVSFLLILASCEQNSVSDFDNLLVLEGYLFQDEKVDSIHLSKCLSFASEDTIYTPVDDAEINIIRDNNRFLLVNAGNGYYNYNGSDLLIQEGDTYSIEVMYNGQITTSTTVVPTKTSINELTDNVIAIDTVFTFGPPQFTGTEQEGLEITWNNPDNRYFYVLIESADSASLGIEMGVGDGRFGGMRPPQNMIFRFRSEPFIGDSYFLNSRMLEKYGKHVVKVYSVNEEYANLFENRSQDSRNLSEPVTNVRNGLGIFTAFSYAEEVFYVKNKYSDR
jgi:hypothetical protein